MLGDAVAWHQMTGAGVSSGGCVNTIARRRRGTDGGRQQPAGSREVVRSGLCSGLGAAYRCAWIRVQRAGDVPARQVSSGRLSTEPVLV